MLKHAADSGWIRNEKFPSLRARAWHIADTNNSYRVLMENIGKQESWSLPDPTEEEVQAALAEIDMPATLQRSMPYMRNLLAHGSNILHPNSRTTLRTVWEVLNQVFEPPATSSQPESQTPN